MNKAYVVGYGMVDCLGNNPEQCFTNMCDDQDYSSELDWAVAENYKITCGHRVDESKLILPEGWDTKNTTKAQRLAMHATKQALDMAGLPHSINVAVLFSSVSNDTEEVEANFNRLMENKRLNPRGVVNRIPDMICAHISGYWQFMGMSTATFASCATGLVTIDYAMRLLDEYDYVVCGAADAGTFKVAMKYFNAIGAIGNVSMPFDDRRSGFAMGDGAGVLILASEASVKKYNARVHATLYPAGLASDAFDQTSPAQDGRGATLALNKAFAHCPHMVDAINAHATSTPVGDVIEYEVCTNRMGPTPIYAPKSKIGHTLAAASILETIYAIESMKHNVIPHIQTSTELSMDKLGCLVKHNQAYENKKTLRTLNNSFGFGGKCAAQIIEVTNE